MNKLDYIEALDAELGFMTAAEREDIVMEFDSHLSDAREARPDLSEDELIARLPPPASIAATYLAEFPLRDDGEPKAEGGRAAEAKGADSHFHDFFRYARHEEAVLSGEAEGVQRVELIGLNCDIETHPGASFTYAIKGRWDDEGMPAISQSGGLWRIDCGDDADSLELSLPDSLVELVATSASGDMVVSLPAGANASLRSASGDITLRCDGGSVRLSSATGDLTVEGSSADAELKSVSGDIGLSLRGHCGALVASTKSGDVKALIEDGSADTKLHSISGDLSLRLPEGSRHALEAETISGDLHSSYGTVRRGVVGARLSHGDGPSRVYAKTISGDIRIA